MCGSNRLAQDREWGAVILSFEAKEVKPLMFIAGMAVFEREAELRLEMVDHGPFGIARTVGDGFFVVSVADIGDCPGQDISHLQRRLGAVPRFDATYHNQGIGNGLLLLGP
jgi:hypothetical protein